MAALICYPKPHVALRGWKPEIGATDWTIVRVEHDLSGQGFATRLGLEWRAGGGAPEPDVD